MKNIVFSCLAGCLLFTAGAFGATAPSSLTISGSALNESTEAMPMKYMADRNLFELFTSLKTGEYTFSDTNAQGGNITVEGENVPYCIRVDYSGDAPVVTVKKVEKVTLWAPWNQYTIGELGYAMNSTFRGTHFSADLSLWGDNRYRIRIIFGEDDFETYGNEHDDVPTDDTTQDYYDLYLTQNGQWFDPDYKYKIAQKYEGRYFDVEVCLSATENYTHYITMYQSQSNLPQATQMQMEGDALENGTLALFKQKEDGVFEFVGGLKEGSFKIKGLNDTEENYFSLSDEGELVAEDKAFSITDSVAKPYYIKVDLVQGIFKMDSITNCYLNYGSGTADDRIPFEYDTKGRFFAQSVITIPMASWGRLDERYKFFMTLGDGTQVAWGYSKIDAEDPSGSDYYRLYSVNNDAWAYSFKFMQDVWDQELDIELLFDPSGNYTHHYASTSETGLATPAQDGGVSIYPTIVIDNFTVDAQEDGFSVEIFTIDGAKVFATSTNGNHLSVDNANLTSGLYLVKVTQAGKVLATQSIVKQ